MDKISITLTKKEWEDVISCLEFAVAESLFDEDREEAELVLYMVEKQLDKSGLMN